MTQRSIPVFFPLKCRVEPDPYVPWGYIASWGENHIVSELRCVDGDSGSTLMAYLPSGRCTGTLFPLSIHRGIVPYKVDDRGVQMCSISTPLDDVLRTIDMYSLNDA